MDVFPNAHPAAIDLLNKLLQFNPSKRLSAEEALKHPYVASFHQPEEEPVASRPIEIPMNDNIKYSIAEYREKLYHDIMKRKKEIRRRLKERA